MKEYSCIGCLLVYTSQTQVKDHYVSTVLGDFPSCINLGRKSLASVSLSDIVDPPTFGFGDSLSRQSAAIQARFQKYLPFPMTLLYFRHTLLSISIVQ